MARVSEYKATFGNCPSENGGKRDRQMMPVHGPVANDRVDQLARCDATNNIINLVQRGRGRGVQSRPDNGVDLVAIEVSRTGANRMLGRTGLTRFGEIPKLGLVLLSVDVKRPREKFLPLFDVPLERD